MLEFDARLQHSHPGCGPGGHPTCPINIAGDHTRLGVLSATDHHSWTKILLNQEKKSNEMEQIFLRSCFPNSNFPSRFPECPL
jgi:hypothetical protein